jgi:hypothetical protein
MGALTEVLKNCFPGMFPNALQMVTKIVVLVCKFLFPAVSTGFRTPY